MRSNITSSDNHSHKVEYEGTFSDETICDKVLKLEDAEMTFQTRQYRYAIPEKFFKEITTKQGNRL